MENTFNIAPNITICLIQKIAPMTFNDLKHKIFANYEAGAISDYELSGLLSDIADYLNLKTTTKICASEVMNLPVQRNY